MKGGFNYTFKTYLIQTISSTFAEGERASSIKSQLRTVETIHYGYVYWNCHVPRAIIDNGIFLIKAGAFKSNKYPDAINRRVVNKIASSFVRLKKKRPHLHIGDGRDNADASKQ